MTTLTLLDALERPSILGGAERSEDEPVSAGGPTLDEVLSGAWEGLLAGRAASCPVCGGALKPRYGSGPGPVAGRCGDCGSELS